MADKRVRYTRHAMARLSERGIDRHDVEAALFDSAPIDVVKEGKTVRRSRAGRFPLKIVFLETEDEITVITVMRLDQ